MNNNQITRVVSPSSLGGETKNQDRAVFDKKTNTACVCDGTTSSPYSEQAAAIVSNYASLILNNIDNLNVISELLYAHRNKVLQEDVAVNPAVPESIRDMVRDAAKQGLKNSFQTTVVAVGFTAQDSCIQAKVLSCGDSGFFAYSSAGQVLVTNLLDNEKQGNASSQDTIAFSPGSELLVKSDGQLSNFPDIAGQVNIQNPDKWLLCRAICSMGKNDGQKELQTAPTKALSPNEPLLVPKYLFSSLQDPSFREYGRLYYSRFIRRLSTTTTICSDIHFNVQGNVTAVLPDHFSTGNWEYFEDRFPKDTHFLLCSDGFYRVFSNPAVMWAWLTNNRQQLSQKASRKVILDGLHQILHQTCGDDDISFVWISPRRENHAL